MVKGCRVYGFRYLGVRVLGFQGGVGPLRAYLQGCTRGHAADRISCRGPPGPVGFPEKSRRFRSQKCRKCENRRFHTFTPKASPPLIGFPDPTPQKPSVLRPSGALLIGIHRLVATPVVYLVRWRTQCRSTAAGGAGGCVVPTCLGSVGLLGADIEGDWSLN
jgi:hypothetical protein